MATFQHEREFADEILVAEPLNMAIEWIRAHLAPDDVFDDDTLIEHARVTLEINAVYSERNILDFVQGTYNPSEVFTDRQLENWAEGEGYTKSAAASDSSNSGATCYQPSTV